MNQEIEKSILEGQMLGHHLTRIEEEGEKEKLAEWLKETSHQDLYDEVSSSGFLRDSCHFHQNIDSACEYSLFLKKQRSRNIVRYLRYGISAAALIAIGLTITLLYKSENQTGIHTPYAQTEILPGSTKATLILENNRQIELTDHPEQITNQGEVIADQDNALLAYRNKNENLPAGDIPRHRLITPIGGEYRLMLSDGTKVWLNANSELSYPVVFSGQEREIRLHGEAYFEVAPDKNKPFRVRTDKFDIVVTGTAFNVSVYPEEDHHQVALVHGGVNIMSGTQLLTHLQPGKQIDYQVADGRFSIGDADIEAVIAWKDGLFLFREEPLSSITRKLGRWYDIEFSTPGGKTERFYSGTIKRDEPLTHTLEILRMTNEIDFKWKGSRKIEVITLP